MAVFNKKGGGAQGAGSGPLRWLPVGQNFNLLRLMFQAPGSPSGPFKNPAYKSYIAKISNEPLDFLLPDRSIVAARCVWIISGGRPSQHGFHLVVVSSGRENLQRLSGQEGVSSRHFSAELIAEAAKADASERTGVPRSATGVTIKPKPKPASKAVDDFSDLSGESAGTSSASFLDDAPSAKPAAARPAVKGKPAATDLGEDDFLSGAGDAGGAAVDQADGGAAASADDLDFQSYKGAKGKPSKAPAAPEADDEFFSGAAPKKSAAPAGKPPKAPAAEDSGFLSDGSDDLIQSTPGGRTWSLDDDAAPAAEKPAPAAAPASGDLVETPAVELEAPAAELEAPAEPEMPEEPAEPAMAEAAPAAADANPFEADISSPSPVPADSAQSAPPIEAEAIPEDDPFAEFDRKPVEPAPAAPAETPPASAAAANPFDEFGGDSSAAPAPAPGPSIGDDLFEDKPAEPAVSAPPVSAPPPVSEPASPAAAAMAAEALKEELAPAPASAPAPAPAAEEEPSGWDLSDGAHAAEPPVAAPAPETPAAPAVAATPAVDHDEFAGDGAPAAATPAAATAAGEEPVAMDEFAADEMAARVAGETDASDLLKAEPVKAEIPSPVSGPPAAAASSLDGEPMFADETEAALVEAEDLTGPEALIARTKKTPLPQAGAPDEVVNAYAHDDVAYFADLPKDAAKGSGDILSAEARRLAAQPPVSAPAAAPAAPVAPAGDDEAVAMGSEMDEEPVIAAGSEPDDKIAALRAKGAPAAFEDEAVAVGDEVSNAEDIFGERQKVAKLDAHEFPHEAGNGRDHDSEKMADLRYTNLNTEDDTNRAIAEADSIMSAEDFFKEEVAAVVKDEPVPEPAVSEPAVSAPPAPESSVTINAISGPPAHEVPPPVSPPVVSQPPEQVPVQASVQVSAPPSAPVPEPAKPAPAARPDGAWRKFTGDVSTELKNKAKQSKIVERAPDMIRFDLKVRVLWPEDGLTEGTLCVKDRAPSVWLSAADIRKITPEAEVEF